MRHRAPAQTIVIAAVAMVAVVGAVAMVIDAGMFFVIQRQLQSAADAGALAGAWYDPVCPASAEACHPTTTPSAADVGHAIALANAQTVNGLCGGSVNVPPPNVGSIQLNLPQGVNVIVVTAECDAPYTFGRILGLLTPRHITASAAAGIGDRAANGDLTNFVTNPGCADPVNTCRIARLLE
jgi:uncharacterized membrane protein